MYIIDSDHFLQVLVNSSLLDNILETTSTHTDYQSTNYIANDHHIIFHGRDNSFVFILEWLQKRRACVQRSEKPILSEFNLSCVFSSN